MDGTPIPGAHENVNAPANGSSSVEAAVSGILTNVAAGQHTVAFETKNSANVVGTNIRVDAVRSATAERRSPRRYLPSTVSR